MICKCKHRKIMCISLLSTVFLLSACSLSLDSFSLGKAAKESSSYEKNEDKKFKKASASSEQEEEGDGRKEGNKSAVKESEFSPEDETSFELPPNSSQNDGNSMANLLCYARMVKYKDILFFRNPFDNQKLYKIEKGKKPELLLEDTYIKDMHIVDNYIYFANTSPGDSSQVEVSDKNLYRYNISSGEKEKLTNISFAKEGTWLSFDTIKEGKAYFSYYDGINEGYSISRVKLDGSEFEELIFISLDNVAGNPYINIVGDDLYFLDKRGLNIYKLLEKSSDLYISGFSCEGYLIYDNYLYYVVGAREGAPSLSLQRRQLVSGEEETLYSADSSVSSIQLNIYNDKIYYLTKSEDASVGRLYAAELDGSGSKLLLDRLNWFNILGTTLYYRYSDYQDIESDRKQPIEYISLEKLSDSSAAAQESRALFDSAQFNKGWISVADASYLYGSDGNFVRSSWLEISGDWYYLKEDGKLALAEWIGDEYYVGGDGKMLKETMVEGRYYVDSEGHKVRNSWVNISGRSYYFTEDGSVKNEN